jgi:hypothetical protein
MEKTSRIVLTGTELESFLASGEVPKRIQKDWGVSKEELGALVENGETEVLTSGGCKNCQNCNSQRDNKDD